MFDPRHHNAGRKFMARLICAALERLPPAEFAEQELARWSAEREPPDQAAIDAAIAAREAQPMKYDKDYFERFRQFKRDYCEGHLYATCAECRYASLTGCTHPQHPKNHDKQPVKEK